MTILYTDGHVISCKLFEAILNLFLFVTILDEFYYMFSYLYKLDCKLWVKDDINYWEVFLSQPEIIFKWPQ